MIRLHLIVEGQTEEAFVRDVLAPELGALNIFIDAHLITTRRTRCQLHRGGALRYSHTRDDLIRWMRQDQSHDAYFSTMIDFYRLPKDFPGIASCVQLSDPIRKVNCLESAFAADLDHRRFIPYIQLHEFESLLFADPRQLPGPYPDDESGVNNLERIRNQFASPEHINDGPETAASARICAAIPRYSKPVAGPLAAARIGLATLRRECVHFDSWLKRLEACALESRFGQA